MRGTQGCGLCCLLAEVFRVSSNHDSGAPQQVLGSAHGTGPPLHGSEPPTLGAGNLDADEGQLK
jgi:hypothetical protein